MFSVKYLVLSGDYQLASLDTRIFKFSIKIFMICKMQIVIASSLYKNNIFTLIIQ